MKKHLLIFLTVIFCFQFVTAQKSSTVLENGIPVEKGDRIFLKYYIGEKALKIDAAKTEQDVDFKTLEDSIIYLYLVRENAINVYLRPLNPLNYSYGTEIKVRIDPINEEAAKAVGLILDELINLKLKSKTAPALGSKLSEISEQFKNLNDTIAIIHSELEITKKDEIKEIFRELKAISFDDENMVKRKLTSIEYNVQSIERHYDGIDSLIKIAKDLLEEYNSDFDTYFADAFIAKYVYSVMLKDYSLTLEEQKKRLTNLQAAYKLVKDMQEKASFGGGTGQLIWCIHVGELKAQVGSISDFTVTINEGGYELSESKEIVSKGSTELINRSFSVRRFQRFVPEVSVGTAFTFFEYNTYGTTTDSTGQQLVASPTKNIVQNLNISTMINFNYYIQNSPINPFWQVGLGINSEIPSILAGVGLRSNINGSRRITISGGLAMSWLKELESLEVGDEVSGTDDIDKDFKYSSSPTFTGYIGVQYNF